MTDDPYQITERGDPRDRIANQREAPTLFDVTRTTATRCSVCGAVRDAGAERAPDCRIDRERETGDYARRPLGCLNMIDPGRSTIPY